MNYRQAIRQRLSAIGTEIAEHLIENTRLSREIEILRARYTELSFALDAAGPETPEALTVPPLAAGSTPERRRIREEFRQLVAISDGVTLDEAVKALKVRPRAIEAASERLVRNGVIVEQNGRWVLAGKSRPAVSSLTEAPEAERAPADELSDVKPVLPSETEARELLRLDVNHDGQIPVEMMRAHGVSLAAVRWCIDHGSLRKTGEVYGQPVFRYQPVDRLAAE